MDSRAQPGASLDLATREGAVPFAPTWRRHHLTADERIARGRAARYQVPRSSHGRRGDRIAIAAYLGKCDTFDQAKADFSVACADQTERDYAAFSAAVDSGRLVAQVGP